MLTLEEVFDEVGFGSLFKTPGLGVESFNNIYGKDGYASLTLQSEMSDMSRRCGVRWRIANCDSW